jgi:hypothetical protein
MLTFDLGGKTALQLLRHAEQLMMEGKSEAASSALEEAVRKGESGAAPSGERQAARAARYTLALLHLCSRVAKPGVVAATLAKADAHLHTLGFRFRIAREAFVGGVPMPRLPALTGPPKDMLQVVDDAIPPRWVEHLCQAFSPASPFWAEHRYDDPATGYFSYNFPVAGPNARSVLFLQCEAARNAANN